MLIFNVMHKYVSSTVPHYPKPSSAHFFSGTLFLAFAFCALLQLAFSESCALLNAHGNFLKQVGYFCVMICGNPSRFSELRSRCRLNATAVLGQDPGMSRSRVPTPLWPSSHAEESSSPEPEHEPWHVAGCCSECSVEQDHGACQGMHGNINIDTATDNVRTACLEVFRLPLKSMGICLNKISVKME